MFENAERNGLGSTTAREASYTTASKSYLDEFSFIDFQRRVLYSLHDFFFFCKVAKRVRIVKRAVIIGEEIIKQPVFDLIVVSFLSINFLFDIEV